MASIIDRPIRLDHRTPASGAPTAARFILPHSRTTRAERFLLLTAVILFPLENHIPAVAGFSVMYFVFAALAAYVIVNRPHILSEIWCHPVFIAAYVFIGVSALLEFSSPLSRYQEISGFGLMVGGAVCVAVVCRDRSALAAGLYGYIVAALWLSVVLYLTSYGTLSGATATNFNEASQLRAHTSADNPVQGNPNGMAFWCAQGAVVAFALSLSSRLKHRRSLLLGIATFCFVAAFLPMSRGAVVLSLLSFAVILYTHGVRHGKALILAFVLGVGVYTLVPDAVWSRMSFSTEKQHGRMEARAWIYTTALDRLPEYVVAGVGAGNFWNKWGSEKGFASRSTGHVIGSHSGLLQITIFWGVLGLVMFLWVVWQVYRCIPLHCGRDELSLALLGILVSLGALLLQTHVFQSKTFAFGVGMLVGARHWIWSTGIVSAVEGNKCSLSARISRDCHSG